MRKLSSLTRAICEVAHAISQARAIKFLAAEKGQSWWIDPEVDHAIEHMNNALEDLDDLVRKGVTANDLFVATEIR